MSLVFQLRFKVKNNPFVVSLSNHFKPDNSISQCTELRITPLIIGGSGKTFRISWRCRGKADFKQRGQFHRQMQEAMAGQGMVDNTVDQVSPGQIKLFLGA